MPKASATGFALLLKFCAPAEFDPDHEPKPGDAGAESDAGSVLGSPDASAESPEAGSPPADAQVDGEVLGSPLYGGPPGLYADPLCERLAPGVRPYAPAFSFWADGAEKERFVYLPEGSVITADAPDNWTFPVGTRLYKTFLLEGMRLETRLIEKVSDGHGADAWTFTAYAWDDDERTVRQVSSEGLRDVRGTSHDIPSLAECTGCHSAAGQDAINGFAAIQLNHADSEVSLATLVQEHKLASPRAHTLLTEAVIPGDALAYEALGILHANCAHCHGGATPRARLTLQLMVGQPSLEATSLFLSTVEQPLTVWTGRSQPTGEPILSRIAAGAPEASGIIARMSARGSRDQMPPRGTELVDHDSVAALSAWIASLPRAVGEPEINASP